MQTDTHQPPVEQTQPSSTDLTPSSHDASINQAQHSSHKDTDESTTAPKKRGRKKATATPSLDNLNKIKSEKQRLLDELKKIDNDEKLALQKYQADYMNRLFDLLKKSGLDEFSIERWDQLMPSIKDIFDNTPE